MRATNRYLTYRWCPLRHSSHVRCLHRRLGGPQPDQVWRACLRIGRESRRRPQRHLCRDFIALYPLHLYRSLLLLIPQPGAHPYQRFAGRHRHSRLYSRNPRRPDRNLHPRSLGGRNRNHRPPERPRPHAYDVRRCLGRRAVRRSRPAPRRQPTCPLLLAREGD